MNIHEFAKKLNGRSEGAEITKTEEEQAKELGIVVVFAYSDDNVEFRGAIYDEVGCCDGGEVFLDESGIFEECEDECKYYKKAKKSAKLIECCWCADEKYAWTYETDIPHATFDVLDEEGNKWCRGIVFNINNLEVSEC